MKRMSEQSLWIVVSGGKIEALKNLKTAVGQFENLSQFVMSESEIVCLTYVRGSKEAEWKIETVPLKDIAEKILEIMG